MKQGKIRWLIIIEVIAFYFSILNIISHVRGPISYEVDMTTVSLLNISSMTSFFDMGVSIEDNNLPIVNTVPGQTAGYQGELSLKGLEGVAVSFFVDCPAEYAGNEFYVDLYNYEENYDSPDQDYRLTLAEGFQEVKFQLPVGEEAPDNCQIRFFTNGIANYTLEDVEVHEAEELPKVTLPMGATMLALFIILGMTSGYAVYKSKKDENRRR